jgi:hypothetical protein
LDDQATAEQMIRSHGKSAAFYANDTASALDALGDAEGAARWRRVRDLVLTLSAEKRERSWNGRG